MSREASKLFALFATLVVVTLTYIAGVYAFGIQPWMVAVVACVLVRPIFAVFEKVL